MRVLSFILNLLCFILPDIAIIAFCLYLKALLSASSKKHLLFIKVSMILSIFDSIIILFLAFTNHLFYIDANGNYQEYGGSSIPYIFSGFIMLFLIGAVIINHEHFSKRQQIVIILYLILPVPPICVEMLSDIYSLTGVSMTLSLLLVYVLIQASALERGKMREVVLEEISYSDLLTDLNNRRAYYNYIGKLRPQQNVGILFCDVNGLKYTNDHFGHAAGDQLLIRFSQLIIESFQSKHAYRVSGDEFIVVIPDVSHDAFLIQVQAFRKIVMKNDFIASVGHAYGTGCCIEHLVSEAESIMYEDKQKYHKSRVEESAQLSSAPDSQ